MRTVLVSTRRRRAVAVGVLALTLGGASLATPASAALLDSGDTTVTFTVGVVGGVSILPSPAVVGLPSGSNAITGALTTVVTDLRVDGGSWTDTVTTEGFSLVGATSPGSDAVVPPSKAKMWTTSANVSIPGTATIENLYTDADNALTLSSTGAELVSATTTNVNVTTLLSSILIDVTGKQTGAYTGTITQSVS